MHSIRRCIIPVLSTMFLLFSVGRVTYAAQTYDTPTNSEFKAYMDYRSITNKSSKQYQIQQRAVTDENGLRVYDGRYCVAIGSYFNAPVGTYIDVQLETGVVLNCVVGDAKADAHTDALNRQARHGNIVEFIVDQDVLQKDARYRGDVSAIAGMEGGVCRIVVYDYADLSQDTVVKMVQEVSEVDLGDTSVKAIEYSGDTDTSSVYTEVEEEVFETETVETFVSYSPEEEVVFIY